MFACALRAWGMEMRNAVLQASAVLLIALMFVMPRADATSPTTWSTGQEEEITGHSFKEEYWGAEITNTTGNTTTKFCVNYVNNLNLQAFLVALKTHEKDGKVSTLPFQFFGMHYYTAKGEEVFLGAVLAFLLAYNDTYNGSNGMPDPGNEPMYYIIPFGVGDLINGTEYMPEVEQIAPQKLDTGHYKFGMRYKNLYAKIVDANNPLGFLLSAAFPIYIAKFSELTVTYDIKLDRKTGQATAETYYTIGQVSKLWFFGVPVDPSLLNASMGIAAVHYIAMFTSLYSVTGAQSNATINTGITKPVDENLTISVGSRNDRAIEIGYRGTYDLINETTSAKVETGKPAYNLLVKPSLSDIILVGWQTALAMDIMCTFAYGLSKELQTKYSSPADLQAKGSESFKGTTLWYAVAFPSFKGLRIEHDPVYTMFFSPSGKVTTPVKKGACNTIVAMGILGLVAIPAIAMRRKGE